MAQNQSASGAQTSAPAADQAPGQEIVVTGSLFAGSKITPSPVTTITTEALDQRGINTIQDAVQQLSSNNGAALTNSFSANGAFAGGASAVSLRGMTTNSTLVLFDGLRAAYYPLADDGSRNFVDLNTIPDDIVDRIEVVRDGASSSYGADAIAGVVNIITKKQFKGLSGRVEAGVAQRGFGANQRLSLTAGTGDLDEKGYNAYISGFYYHSALVRNSDLKAPFNSDDKTRIGGPDDTINPGTFGVTNAGSNLYVAPGSGGRYQLLANNCLNGSAVSSSAAQLADNDLQPSSVCRVDSTNRYGIVAPEIERFGASARFTANLNDTTQAYLALNFQQSTSSYTGSPSTIYANAPTGVFYPQYSTRTNAANYAPGSQPLTLPVYVCAARVNCATAADGRLNPNNPFAATGDTALLVGGMPNSVTSDLTRNRVYRAALGVTGQVFGWDYTFDATAMHSDLKHQQNGYVYIQHLLDVIADGSYNFVDPSANSAATINYLMPQNITNASSDLYQGQISFKKAVMDLPGGPLNVGFGGSLFYEAIDSPSANSDFNGPTERYFTINAFGTEGHRTVASAFGEINAPVLPILDLNLSGRYDHYSTGQSYFSPKVGA